MKRIALNGRFSGSKKPTGSQIAAFNIFDAVVKTPREVELVIFADDRYIGVEGWKNQSGVIFIQTPFQDWSASRCHLWEQLILPILGKRHNCSVMHHPMQTSPIWQNKIKGIVTLNDVNFINYPEWFTLTFRMAYKICSIPGLKRCSKIVTISEYVKNQSHKALNIDAEKIEMIYDGVEPKIPTEPRTGKYILAVGSLQPHKNLVGLIRAHQILRKEYPEIELLVVGSKQKSAIKDNNLNKLFKCPGVVLTGYLSETELANAYLGAKVFCYPSFEEGFGLPLLEAMAIGCPVVTSNTSCLPEIAGPALLVDPKSASEIAIGIQKILTLSNEDRIKIIEKGKAWASEFSWRNTAEKYLELYNTL
jgi:glycosyltransferase involved in cell wall biosynthesis